MGVTRTTTDRGLNMTERSGDRIRENSRVHPVASRTTTPKHYLSWTCAVRRQRPLLPRGKYTAPDNTHEPDVALTLTVRDTPGGEPHPPTEVDSEEWTGTLDSTSTVSEHYPGSSPCNPRTRGPSGERP